MSPETKFTPGPWAWMGNKHGLYLATTHSGRRYVMGFRRMGLNGAQPTFQVDRRMVPASELVRFDVGDGNAKGFAQGKNDPSVYRYDVASIDAPDAYLIAAAPDLYEALAGLLGVVDLMDKRPSAGGGVLPADKAIATACARAALARAQERPA